MQSRTIWKPAGMAKKTCTAWHKFSLWVSVIKKSLCGAKKIALSGNKKTQGTKEKYAQLWSSLASHDLVSKLLYTRDDVVSYL